LIENYKKQSNMQSLIGLKVLPLLRSQSLATKSKGKIHTQPNAGFSLIEVLVVVLMVGILSAIAAPGWLAFVNRQRVNKANDVVLAALQEAQREAKKKKLSYSFSFKNDSGTAQILIHAGNKVPTSGWKPLGENIGVQSGQVLLYTNLASIPATSTAPSTANKKASTNITYTTPGSGTITFDYMGTLQDVDLGTAGGSLEQLGLKIGLATPNPGTQIAGNLKRCVILETLIGGIRTGKDTNCN
jgi:prepilin-type N-terminal cleavage/methylation domain-containing protein